MDHKLSHIAAFVAAALLSSACIYQYHVDIERSGEYPLVVEGDIHVGGTSVVKLSYVAPFKLDNYKVATIFAQGYIESEDGSRLDGTPLEGKIFSLWFDTSKLTPTQRYRLHFETCSKDGTPLNQFESEWLTPCPAPTIDELTYSKNDKFKELWVGLSMHCHGSHYFRWTFRETWEYHSDVPSSIEYVPSHWDEMGREFVEGYYQKLSPTMYYCWKDIASSSVNLFSTVNQTEDRFEELAFHTIPLNDKRLQVLYKITVQLEALSEDAYDYWLNLQQKTHEQGSIFAPVPSEMASNVRCTTDPSVQVVGYLNAAVPAEASMFYSNELEGFYVPDPPFERGDSTIAAGNIKAANELMRLGYLPYEEIYTTSPTPSDYTWAYSICIDCRKQGGTKQRPDGWPSGHY